MNPRRSVDAWSQRLKMPPSLLLFVLIVLGMTSLSILYTCAMTYMFHLKEPYGMPLFYDDDRWFDFTVYHDRFQHFGRPEFWGSYFYPFTYPAPLAVLYALLYRIPQHALRYYMMGYAVAVAAAAFMLRRTLLAHGLGNSGAMLFTATFLLCSYPLRVLYESANTEGIVAVISAYGVLLVLRDRCYSGGALIAVAGSMKVFPFILLALLLSKRRYRELAGSLVVAATVTLVSLAAVGPSVLQAQQNIDAGILYVKYTFIFSVNSAAVNFNHSLFTPIKFAAVALYRQGHPFAVHNRAEVLQRMRLERVVLNPVFNAYVLLAATLGVALYFLRIRRMPLLNQMLALSACSLILPPLSADYTLLHLMFPFVLLCLYAANQWRAGLRAKGLTAAILCFPAIFSFQTYLTLRYRFSCEFRTVAIVVLIGIVLRHPFRWIALDGAEPHGGHPSGPMLNPMLKPVARRA